MKNLCGSLLWIVFLSHQNTISSMISALSSFAVTIAPYQTLSEGPEYFGLRAFYSDSPWSGIPLIGTASFSLLLIQTNLGLRREGIPSQCFPKALGHCKIVDSISLSVRLSDVTWRASCPLACASISGMSFDSLSE